ncbi:MAG: glycosyltransferase family 2 protein [Thermoleophilia bacterium]|nr:glycosyltransferase family 2 protein [Thermoleophilia bacterium]
MTKLSHRHWIVVPCYNEEKWIESTIDAIAAQSDTDFVLCIVNNASTDTTREMAEARIASHPQLTGMVLDELDKGTGCAADSGFRFAIDNGAEIVFRTDADCVPTPTWFAELKRTMIEK